MHFRLESLTIPEVILIRPNRIVDKRGYFMETYRKSDFATLGIDATFVQDNQAMSADSGTIRGLHFQMPPKAQAKLVRVLSGAIFDVAVDLRKGSDTYGRWVGAELSADGGEELFVPRGFAHGYCTLKPATEVLYKCDAYYAADREDGIHFGDPSLAIDWPVTATAAVVSDRDRALPSFQNFKSPFIA
jgi:dTDP-4-dehydrorhamnose 3,5-epimerase